MKLKNIFLGLVLSCLINNISAQNGLERIIVERYYQTNAADGSNATANGATLATGSVVYRVYVDMAVGYKFVQMYGSASHNLKIATSTNFFNDPNYGVATNPLTISATNIKKNTAMIDSWLTMGGASNGMAGVMKSEDTDGSVGNTNSLLANNPGGCYGLAITGTGAKDGMITSSAQTAIAPSILGITSSQMGLFDQTSGSDFTVTNGSIAALGGIVGPTSSNMVLIGQFTTDGVFSFQLNVQLLSPTGQQEKWVASNPVSGEYTHASLSSPTYTYAGNISGAENICLTGNTGTTLTLSASIGNIKWQKATITAGVIGTFTDITGANSATYATGSLTASTAYRANLSFGTCNSINTSNFTVNVNPVAVAGTAAVNDASGLTVCVGGSKALKVTGNVGSIQWQKSTDGTTWSNVTGATSSPYTFTNIVGNTSYKAVISSGVCATTATTNVLAITTSTAPVAGTITPSVSTICSGGSSTLTLNGSSGAIAWQKATVTNNVVGTFAAVTGTTNTLSTGALSASTAYRAVLTSGPCTQAISPQIIINVDKLAVSGSITAATSVCTAGNITLSLTGYTGTSFQWQSAATATGTYSNITGATGATYTVSNATASSNKNYKVIVTSGVCPLTATTAVKSFVVDVPSVAGSVTGGAAICSAGGGSLTLAGNTGLIQWQSSTDNGTTWSNVSGATTATYAASNILVDTKYRASVKNGTCPASNTNPVSFTIVSQPVAGTITGEQNLCIWNNETTLTLNNNVGAIKWEKANITSGVVGTFAVITGATTNTLSTGAITANAAYRATVSIGACASDAQTSNFIVTVGQYVVPKAITASVTTPTGATSSTALCTTNTSKVLTLGTGYVGSIQWQKYSSTSGWTNITGATSATYTITNPTVGGNFFRVKLSVGDCSEGYSTNVMAVWYKSCLVVNKINPIENNVSAENVFLTEEKSMSVAENDLISFDAVAFPNPFEDHFTVNLLTENQDQIILNLFDMSGKVIESYTVSPFEIENIQIGKLLTSGIYNVQVTQGNSVKTLRLIKQ